MIDLFILIFYIIIASKALNAIQQNMDYSDDSMYNMWAIGLVLILPFILYHPVSEALMNGQSVGKKLMGLQVVHENGGKPGISQYIIRWLIRTSDYTVLIIIIYAPYISIYGMQFFTALGGSLALLLIDIILVNSKKNQRLGDLLAHTIVINNKQKSTIDDTIFQHVEDNYTPSFPQVMRLSDRDINALKSILDSARKRHDFDLALQASEKIKAHLKIDTTLSPFDFLEVLMKDYNYLATQ